MQGEKQKMSNTTEIETSVLSINDIPEITRRKSEKLNEIIEKVSALKANQVLCILIPRTKPNKKTGETQLNRQFVVKVASQLGEKYTVQSRMGNEKLKQNVNELYLYVYKTPATPTPTTK